MQLNIVQKQSIVNTIKQSESFKNAPTSIALLQYLFEATAKNEPLKESVIDLDFFGDKGNNEKSNPRVRVNVYNLRKKLTLYYENEGKNDLWKVSIPKGQYLVQFTKTHSQFERYKKQLNGWKIAPYVALIFLSSLFVWQFLPQKEPKIWSSIWNNGHTNHLYIGDLFGMNGRTITEGNGWTRDFNINTEKEYYEWIKKHPEHKNKISPSTFSYTTTMAALATRDLQALHQTHSKRFFLHFTTKSSTSEIKQGNAVYVGPLKTHNLFVPFFNEGNPYCFIKNRQLHIQKSKKVYNLNSYNQTDEFALVSNYPAPGGTEHLLFISQHDIGVSATVEFFCKKNNLEAFAKQHLNNHQYFTAIFRVKGQDRTSIDMQLVEVIPF
ncbi:hypothetical protein [Ochrovirga pacifica]|uniref:hypothetical protein n=1 Tax=Ochrovirga pacifica TaxID=1042376 RepID=UPI000255A265|nr:hypothetical protein [Ochrovirga pacifica]